MRTAGKCCKWGGRMITLCGRSICGGITLGKLLIFKDREYVINNSHTENIEREFERFDKAANAAHRELELLYQKANDEIGHDTAMIFSIHQIMLADEDYVKAVKSHIKLEKINAEMAVYKTCREFMDIFDKMDDSYMRARKSDIRDISELLIKILTGVREKKICCEEPVIIAAHRLSPAQTLGIDKEKTLALITEKGSSNSHAAIMARTLNIPAVTGAVGITGGGFDGKNTIVDGFNGVVYIEPDEETLKRLTNK